MQSVSGRIFDEVWTWLFASPRTLWPVWLLAIALQLPLPFSRQLIAPREATDIVLVGIALFAIKIVVQSWLSVVILRTVLRGAVSAWNIDIDYWYYAATSLLVLVMLSPLAIALAIVGNHFRTIPAPFGMLALVLVYATIVVCVLATSLWPVASAIGDYETTLRESLRRMKHMILPAIGAIAMALVFIALPVLVLALGVGFFSLSHPATRPVFLVVQVLTAALSFMWTTLFFAALYKLTADRARSILS